MELIDLKRTKDIFLRKDSKNLNLPPGFSKHPVLVCDFNDRFSFDILIIQTVVWKEGLPFQVSLHSDK